MVWGPEGVACGPVGVTWGNVTVGTLMLADIDKQSSVSNALWLLDQLLKHSS